MGSDLDGCVCRHGGLIEKIRGRLVRSRASLMRSLVSVF